MDSVILKGKIASSFTDEEFFLLCAGNPDLRIERNSNLEIVIMSPVTTKSSFSSGAIFGQLYAWNLIGGNGYVFDSSTGFTLPDRSIFSPDASWVSKDKFDQLTEEEKDMFAPVCPEFIIEVKSKTDSISDLQNKMKNWIKNGAELAWLIDPRDQVSYLYSSNNVEEIRGLNKKLMGEGKVKGFVLDLSKITL